MLSGIDPIDYSRLQSIIKYIILNDLLYINGILILIIGWIIHFLLLMPMLHKSLFSKVSEPLCQLIDILKIKQLIK
jgi:hypothetical protein